jgi:hypothetical protein
MSAAVATGVENRKELTKDYLKNTQGQSTEGWSSSVDGDMVSPSSEHCPTMSDGTQIGYFDRSWDDGVSGVSYSQTTLKKLPAGGSFRLALMSRGSAKLTSFRLVVTRVNPSTDSSDNASGVRRRSLDSDDESGNETTTTGATGDSSSDSNTTTLAETELMHVGANGGDYGEGWNENYVDFDTPDGEGSEVTVSVEVSGDSGAWASFTNARLTQTKATVTGIEDVTVDSDSNFVIDLDNATIYDLYGRRVKNPAPGIYVVNGRKVVVK